MATACSTFFGEWRMETFPFYSVPTLFWRHNDNQIDIEIGRQCVKYFMVMFSLLSQGYGTYDGRAKKDSRQEIHDHKVRNLTAKLFSCPNFVMYFIVVDIRPCFGNCIKWKALISHSPVSKNWGNLLQHIQLLIVCACDPAKKVHVFILYLRLTCAAKIFHTAHIFEQFQIVQHRWWILFKLVYLDFFRGEQNAKARMNI